MFVKSSRDDTPPPTQNGIDIFSATFETNSKEVFLSSLDAVIS